LISPVAVDVDSILPVSMIPPSSENENSPPLIEGPGESVIG
jgi:hypothetical protein